MTTTPNVHPKSTITVDQIIPVATLAVGKFLKSTRKYHLLRSFGSHYTFDDLVMEAVEKVIRANPMYLTRSYVYLAAKCVCIDRMQQKKLSYLEIQSLYEYEDGDTVPVEELLEADTYDHLSDLEAYVLEYLSPTETKVYSGLTSRKLYVEIAEDLNVSVRTLERMVHDLKWKIEFLLTEEDPLDEPE